MKWERIAMSVRVGFWLSMTKSQRLRLLEKLATEGICYGDGRKDNTELA